MAQSAPLTERKYVLPFVLVTSLFFLWAFGVNLNDVLIPHFKSAFSLSDFQSSFIQVAFFGGYFLAAIVAGRAIEGIGYKRGILCGLFLCATGALLFVPAGSLGVYGLFLLSSFVLACGQSFLEVAANPYAAILGAPESSERRLNFAQSFNGVGYVVALYVVGPMILSATVPTAEMVKFAKNGSDVTTAAHRGGTCAAHAGCVAGVSRFSNGYRSHSLSGDRRHFSGGRRHHLLRPPAGNPRGCGA